MKKEGDLLDNNPMAIGLNMLNFNNSSLINLTGVFKIQTSCGLAGNRTRNSCFGDTCVTITPLAH